MAWKINKNKKKGVFHALEPFTHRHLFSPSPYRPSFRDGRPEKRKRGVLGSSNCLEHGNSTRDERYPYEGRKAISAPRERCGVVGRLRNPLTREDTVRSLRRISTGKSIRDARGRTFHQKRRWHLCDGSGKAKKEREYALQHDCPSWINGRSATTPRETGCQEFGSNPNPRFSIHRQYLFPCAQITVMSKT